MQPLATFLPASPYHAVFSPCGSYRYYWYYRWSGGPCVMFIGLNPSKANGHRTDATERRCIAYAKRWGFGAVCIVNLFSRIDIDPAALKLASEPVGPRNDRHLMAHAANADLIVAVWGIHGSHLGRDQAVKQLLKGRLHALAVNKDGSPTHPLYQRKDLLPIAYDLNDEEGSEKWQKWKRWNRARNHNERVQAEYLSPVPNETLTTILRLPNRHWHLLNLVARCPRAFDLVRSTPALALALSSSWVFRKNPPSRPLCCARSLLAKRQTEIAAWLGFPDAWSTVKILRKLPPKDCTVLNLLHLRNLFDTHLKILQHLPCLSGSIIRMMTGETDRYRAHPSFLQEISSRSGLLDRTVGLLRYTLWLREQLDVRGIIALRSYKQLVRTRDQFVDQLGRKDLIIVDPPPYPPPPLMPTSPHLKLKPMLTEKELLDEGKIQNNCVGTYGSLINRGYLYVYRLLSPERATVSVVLDMFGKWRLKEIKAYQNSEVTPETLSAVLECRAISSERGVRGFPATEGAG